MSLKPYPPNLAAALSLAAAANRLYAAGELDAAEQAAALSDRRLMESEGGTR